MSADASGTQHLADDLRGAIRRGGVEALLASRLADPVSVHHDPPVPTDGPMARAEFAALLTSGPMAGIVPDGVRTYGPVMVTGDVISFESTLAGTATDGEALSIANVTTLDIVEGEIARLTQRYDPATMEALSVRLAPPGDASPKH